MALNLVNLDSAIRKLMLEEIDADIKNNNLYISARLSPTGVKEYPDLLKEAVQSHDDAWLASQLSLSGRISATEMRNGSPIKMRHDANEVLASSEFNRFYLRGLCLWAIQNNKSTLTIYRARNVSSPRAASEAKIGSTISPQILLDDLRKNIGIETTLGIPEVNSGLSAKLS